MLTRAAAKASYWSALGAAAENNVEAFAQLGRMYEKGIGVPVNLAIALYWYQKAGQIVNTAIDPEFRNVKAAEKDPRIPKFYSSPNNVAEADAYAARIEQELAAQSH